MMYEEFIADFARRTKSNLLVIEENAKFSKDCYEVTQMINSLVGLLVFPQQKYFQKIPTEFPTKEMERILDNSKSTYPDEVNKPKAFNTIIKHMKNAVSHERLSILPQGPQEIEEIVFRDQIKDKYSAIVYTFEIKLSIEEFRIFLLEMCDFAINLKG